MRSGLAPTEGRRHRGDMETASSVALSGRAGLGRIAARWRRAILAITIGFPSFSLAGDAPAAPAVDWRREVIYHVLPRSFRDSDGDRHGDLRGFREKLDYLQALGVTAILFTPLYESGCYHNYFPTDYERIDAEYGTMDDYLAFVREVHRRGMKFLMDMETQYVTGGHPWLEESYRNPGSRFADRVAYADAAHEQPLQILFPAGTARQELKIWPGGTTTIAHLNLNSPHVRAWMSDFFARWVDPNGDGRFDDGVDGFRIDHIKDDLDAKGVFTGLYAGLWQPIFARCRALNPRLFIVGEQADWREYGEAMMGASGADAAFGFRIRFAAAGADPAVGMFDQQTGELRLLPAGPLHREVRATLTHVGIGKQFVVFLENHDLPRWASVAKDDDAVLRLGAVLNLTLPGIASIYYGQELGVTGVQGKWGFDANDIPVREAFPWVPDPDAAGMATWYRDSGPWWDQSVFRTGEAARRALSVQQRDEGSLWNLYRQLIALRRGRASLTEGDYRPLAENVAGLLAFARRAGNETTIVALNTTNDRVVLPAAEMPVGGWHRLSGEAAAKADGSRELPPLGYVILGSAAR